ncbi:hypothetical protein P43SY_004887 [Pythium insidiosum]|uniref:1-phosphatidylinositol-3-phosphate 5-kinase n=1 Tax=Pythium insidiosum TaxID=114742 RepID=A0AAD5M7P4_PYTIN|nr:hypothetical protein P43SY_004887 [Pythium insidiosum]
MLQATDGSSAEDQAPPASAASSRSMPPHSRMDSDPSRLTTFPVPGFFSSTMQLVRESTIGSTSGDSVASTAKSNPPLSASQYWMPDHLCKVCYDCGASFSLFRRRHHCRLCGQIFCYECSGHFIDGAPHGFSGLIRICNFCARYVNASIETKRRASLRSSSSSVANLPSRQPSLSDLSAGPSAPPHSMSSLPVTSPLLFSPVNPHAAAGFSLEDKDATASDLGSPRELQTDEAAESVSQRPSEEDSSAMTMPTPPKLATILSTDSMDYSGDPTAAVVTERVIKPRASLSRRRRSSVELLGAIEAGGFLDSESAAAAAPSAPAARTHRPSLTREALSFRLKSEIHTQREIVLDRYMQGAHARIRTGIQRAVDRVAKHFVDDGLEVKRLTSTLEDMAFVVTGHLLFSMNFRSPNGFNYAQLVKVKSIATATASSSGPPSSGSSSSGARLGKDRYSFTWLAGTVCRKHLTHKQMARQIANPRLLLLACGISYDRSFDANGGSNGKLSSLDTLIEQERSYMGILVDKIARLEPDVIFVEHSVSRHAQELLRARGVAIVLNVKRATLERIARHTDAVVLPSVENIDQADPDEVIGSCRAFYVRTFSVAHDPDDAKAHQGTPPLPTMMGVPPRSRNEAYMYLDGCDPLNGCTVLITGPTKKKLRILKSLMRSVLFMTYRLLLEAHVLSDLDIGVSAGSLPSALEDRERVVWCTVATLREQDAMVGKPRFYQCSLAKHIGIATYLDDDISFGNYLLKEMEGLFLRCNNPKCSYMMVDHVQTYSCRVGMITVSFEELPDDVKAPTDAPSGDNADEHELHVLGALATHFNPRSNTDEVPGCPTIIYWRWCSECGRVVSPFVPLQKHAYKYSFARLLEVFFSEKEQLPPSSMGPLGSSAPYRSHACHHGTMESHVLFFLVGNLVARMELAKRVAVSLTNNTQRRPAAQRRRRSISGPNGDGGLQSTQTELCQAIVEKRRTALRDAFNGLVAQLSEQIAGIQQVIEECDAQSDVCMYLLVQVAAVKKIIEEDHAAMRGKLNDQEEEHVLTTAQPGAQSSIDPQVVKRVIVTDQLQRELYVTACKWIGELSQLHKQIKEHLSRDSNSTGWKSVLWDIYRAIGRSTAGDEFQFQLPRELVAGHPSLQSNEDGPVVLVNENEPITCFAALRGLLYGSDEDFLFSIAHVNMWETLGGKSGASFYRTVDDRFVVKHISSTELQSFLDVLPGYFKYMARVHFDGEDSVLSKTVGMYQTTITRKDTGQKSAHNIVVMENAFFQKQIGRTFDLKGSSRNRYVKCAADGKAPGVLLDGNLMELHEGHPVGVLVEDYEMLFRALRNDTQFLTSINIVDFSLVAGFGGDNADSTKFSQMTVGIIDYLRQFDLIKRVESVSKSVGMIAGQSSPTIIEPALYSKRFMDAMTRYFMPVTPISSNRNEAIILE